MGKILCNRLAKTIRINANLGVSGLQHILDRIPHIRGIHLDQAMEYCKHPYAAVVTYPFAAQPKKKTRDETDGKTKTCLKKNQSFNKNVWN